MSRLHEVLWRLCLAMAGLCQDQADKWLARAAHFGGPRP